MTPDAVAPLISVPQPEECPALTIEEVADLLRIAKSTAYEAAKRGELPVVRIGRRLVVPTAALRRLLNLD